MLCVMIFSQKNVEVALAGESPSIDGSWVRSCGVCCVPGIKYFCLPRCKTFVFLDARRFVPRRPPPPLPFLPPAFPPCRTNSPCLGEVRSVLRRGLLRDAVHLPRGRKGELHHILLAGKTQLCRPFYFMYCPLSLSLFLFLALLFSSGCLSLSLSLPFCLWLLSLRLFSSLCLSPFLSIYLSVYLSLCLSVSSLPLFLCFSLSFSVLLCLSFFSLSLFIRTFLLLINVVLFSFFLTLSLDLDRT